MTTEIFKQKKSSNFNDRRGVEFPSLIVLHYTGMETAEDALDRLCDPVSEVSAHYFIDEDGGVLQLVDEEKRAWHAGLAHWVGESDINSHSIGIEIVNSGHEFGYKAFPDIQINAVIKLCIDIMARYSISSSGILGHSDVAPSRKIDPGELFPWQYLANEGVGIWPFPSDMDYEAAESLFINHDVQRVFLDGIGYDPFADFEDIITAFHRRYYPEKFQNIEDIAQPCIEGTARLLALVRVHNDLKT